MRKFFLLSIVAIIISGSIFSCNKAEVAPDNSTTEQTAVWRTPNGYVIPYSEKDNWKDYLKNELGQEKLDASRYKSRGCTTPTIKCGLECIETRDRDADCTKASSCAPCMNCNCF